MKKSLVEKILKAHLQSGVLAEGREIAVHIDQTLTQDATGTMVYLQFESLGLARVKTELSVSYVDHNTLQDGFENADDHEYLRTVAAKYGIHYSRAGNGICHQVHLERFGVPGATLLGSDSHTPTAGGLGMLAMGAGGIDVAVAMGGGPFFFICPNVVQVHLTGRLSPWVSAKDVILTLLQILTTKGNVNTIIEYGGPGVRTLTIPERATMTNMGAELGVTTSIFPSDDNTKRFLQAQGRIKKWRPLNADTGAEYSRVIDINLNKIVPMAARPHSPDNVCTVRELEGKKVNQVCIGSCTNGSFRDLMIVAKILKKKKVHDQVSLVIAPGSRQVFSMIAENGALAEMIASGARIMETTCGFCIGNGQAPQTSGVSVRTNNRNYQGRSGTKDAEVYLVSTETAVLCSLYGMFKDPLRFNSRLYPRIGIPKRFIITDSMIIRPPTQAKAQKLSIFRGPNIGAPPFNGALAQNLDGEVMIKVGDKITTDHIMPAGNRLKYRSNIPKYAGFVFESLDAAFPNRCLKNKEAGTSNFIIGGFSYGQGSSREHAALCPMFLGVKAVIAKSFERIHSANLVNFGILPLCFENQDDYEQIENGDVLSIPDIRGLLIEDKKIEINNRTKNLTVKTAHFLTERQKQIILHGGLLNYTNQIKSEAIPV